MIGRFTLVAVTAVFSGTLARAETSSCDVTYTHEENAVDLKWDSGWVPTGEKIQVRLITTSKAGINATLPAESKLARHGDLTYTGKTDQGELKMGLWTQLDAKYRITDLDWEGIKLDHEGKLPVPKSWLQTVNNIIEDKDSFTPLVLEGATERPVKVSLDTPKAKLFTLSVPVIEIGIADLSVDVPLSVKATLTCDLEGEKVETTPEGASSALVHTKEGEGVAWAQDSQLQYKGQSVYFAKRKLTISLTFYPEIIVKGKIDLGVYEEKKSWKVAEFEEDVDLLTDTKTWTFAPQPLQFTFTAPPPPPPPGYDGSVPPPGRDAWPLPPGYDAWDPPAGDSGIGAGDGAGDGNANGSTTGGCSCEVTSRGSPAVVWLLVLGLLVVCRRRR